MPQSLEEPGARSPEPGARSPEAGARRPEAGAWGAGRGSRRQKSLPNWSINVSTEKYPKNANVSSTITMR
ncbi:hypothetical protein GCM10010156_63230 [Planobispora rosea]|uniref:Uncharacterized protein n=1 Tax=Planobispora rosea TaxID=35762 RepID=A0A8J3S4F0_PLARO|nr:hypothetical protein GCM10010156_63230 [Planobispora rosea]GIH87622.1 hypothetical protein Pro02_60300 [Planobispora rosea]